MKTIKTVFILVLLLLLAIASTAAYYFFQKYQTNQALINNPEAIAQEEVKALTSKLNQLMALPEDEEPTIATVLEKDKLTDQPFFAKAENGDKVFIYAKALKAILYRPEANKIIEVAPITMQPEESGTPQTMPEPEQPAEEESESETEPEE